MGVLDTISTVTNFFANIGASCVDIVNGALEVFSKFVFFVSRYADEGHS